MDEQDTLGALNDFFAHRQLAADSVPKGARPNGRAGAFVGRSRPRGKRRERGDEKRRKGRPKAIYRMISAASRRLRRL
jgi:hypothetical protein